MEKLTLLLTVMLAFVGTGTVSAQTQENPWGVRVSLGRHSYDGDLGNEMMETAGSDYLFSLGVTRYLNSFVDISLEGSKMQLDYYNDMNHNVVAKRGTEFETDNFSLNLYGKFKLNNPYMLSGDTPFKPFLHLGLGLNMLKHDYGISESVFSIPYGFGVSYELSSRVMLNYKFSYNSTFSDQIDGYPSDPGEIIASPAGRPALDNKAHDDFLTHTVGLTIGLGTNKKPKMSRGEKMRQQALENMRATRRAAEDAQEAAEEAIGAAEKAQEASRRTQRLNKKTLQALRKVKNNRNQTEKINKKLRNHLLNIINNIEFEFDSSKIASNAYDDLNALATVMENYPRLNVHIEGHADERGPTTYNRKLSKSRADAVKNYLVRQGINRDRITTAAYGEKKPDMKGDSPTAYTQNRYVELIFSYEE